MARHLAPAPTLRPTLVVAAPCCPVTGTPCPHATPLPVRVGEMLAAARRTRHAATGREARDGAAPARLTRRLDTASVDDTDTARAA